MQSGSIVIVLSAYSPAVMPNCVEAARKGPSSKECQKIDWSVTGSGQKHRNWCGKFEYGEEDVDWKVVPIQGKGLGVVALRRLPAKYRIIVEPVFTHPNAHPGILKPTQTTLFRI